MTQPGYIIIRPMTWMNENGHGVTYIATTEGWGSLEAAIEAGFEIVGSNDFNIGRISGGRLVAMMWMDQALNLTPSELEKVEKKAGIRESVNLG